MLISGWLLGQLDASLTATASQVADTLQATDFIDNGRLTVQFRDPDDVVNAFLRDRLFFIRVIDRDSGEILGSSLDYAVAVSPAAQGGVAVFETLPLGGGNAELRVYTLPLEDYPLALQVGSAMAEVSATQAQMARMMGAALLLTVLLGIGCGVFVASRALIPIRAITRTVQRVSERDLTQRITPDLLDDELGQLARMVNHMLDRLERAFLRQQRFTADAAHELRTPLSIMQTGIDVVLAQERAPAQYRETLEALNVEVQRLTSLTVGLLQLARADAPTHELQRSKFDLSVLLHTVVDQIASVSEHKPVDVQRNIEEPLWVDGDEDRLLQLLLNVIENAVKYTPAGGAIRVSAARNGAAVRIVVADTGPGISAQHLPHIFDRFYRIDPSCSRSQDGFGLGLAIAQQIAHLHGGEITVSSALGAGTQFTIVLPAS